MITPTFDHERTYWRQGITYLAGVDEVGVGSLAGPVVAAAVIITADTPLPGVRDSKLLSAVQREQLGALIKKLAVAWAVGQSSVPEINRFNIRTSTHLAMRRAADGLSLQPDLLLIDGLPAHPHPTIPAAAIVSGDRYCYSIAAASIIAKVYRDNLMERLHQDFPGYNFARNKGYGTAEHLAALRVQGATIHHRQQYAPVKKVLAAKANLA